MLGHLMTSWHLNIWKVKISLSEERKELSKWSKKLFLVSQLLFVRLTKQTSKNLMDATFTVWVGSNSDELTYCRSVLFEVFLSLCLDLAFLTWLIIVDWYMKILGRIFSYLYKMIHHNFELGYNSLMPYHYLECLPFLFIIW